MIERLLPVSREQIDLIDCDGQPAWIFVLRMEPANIGKQNLKIFNFKPQVSSPKLLHGIDSVLADQRIPCHRVTGRHIAKINDVNNSFQAPVVLESFNLSVSSKPGVPGNTRTSFVHCPAVIASTSTLRDSPGISNTSSRARPCICPANIVLPAPACPVITIWVSPTST